jgi:hypothetical protein
VIERRVLASVVGLLGALVVAACGAESPEGAGAGADRSVGGTSGSGGGNGAGTSGAATTQGGTANGGSSSGGSAGTGGTPPDPEEELESAFEAPVATDRFVWTANPESGNVALIDASTYAVRLARAGFRPTTVAALPSRDGEDGAIVLNQGSFDATVLRVAEDGTLHRDNLETHPGANAVAVSPSGRFAIVWSDARKLDPATLDPTDSLQDVTVLALGDEPTSTTLSVGYRPSQVVFDTAEERAFVVTEPGLSVIELGDDSRFSALVELTKKPRGRSHGSRREHHAGRLVRPRARGRQHEARCRRGRERRPAGHRAR